MKFQIKSVTIDPAIMYPYLHAIHNSLQAVLDLAVEYYGAGISDLAIAIMFVVMFIGIYINIPTDPSTGPLLTRWLTGMRYIYETELKRGNTGREAGATDQSPTGTKIGTQVSAPT